MADELDAMFPAEHQVAEPDKVETIVEPQEPVAEAPPPEPEQPAPEAEPIASSEPQRDQMVPLAALLDDRDKRKAIAEERDRYKRELEEMRNSQQPQQVPDALDDPAGYNAYVSGQIEQAVQKQRLDMSWHFAVKEHGAEATEAARAWAQERAERDPVFRNQLETAIVTEALPVDWLIQQHKRDALLTDIGDPSKLDDWFAREASKRGYVAQSATQAAAAPAVATQQQAPKPLPPRSIASDAAPAAPAQADGRFNVFDGLLTR